MRLDNAVRTDLAPNLHGVVVVRHGRLVTERYYEGADEIGPGPAVRTAFGPDVLHDMRSVTKSIVGLLYGIAFADGKVPHPDQPLLAQFPEYGDLAADTRRARWSIAHALTMTLGIDWNEEDVSYRDPANSDTAMEAAADRYRFVLERPIVANPGERWVYCGGAAALIGRLIAKGTGLTLPDFARVNLFDPLGIHAFEWRRGLDGEPRAASGLRMKPRDLARIGQLVLDRGFWAGRSLVSSSWLEMSLTPKVATRRAGRRYGYHWYMGDNISAVGTPIQRNEQ
jgi:CubicO group peptidase (beta-lactamase class C family)